MIDNEPSSALSLSEAEFVKLRRLLIDQRPPDDDEVMILQSCKRVHDLISMAVNVLTYKVEVVGQCMVKALGRKGYWEDQADIVLMMQEHVE